MYDKSPGRTRSQIWIPLLAGLILSVFYFYHGRMATYERFFSENSMAAPLNSVYYQWLSAVIIFFLVPFLIWTGVLNYSGKSMGFRLGNWKRGLLVLGIGLPLMLLYAWGASQMYEFQGIYPYYKYIGMESPGVIVRYYLSALLFFLSYEAFIRGFILNAVKDDFGFFGSVLIAALAGAPVFIGASEMQGVLSVVISILFGISALKTGSIFYTALLWWVWQLAVDWFIILGI